MLDEGVDASGAALEDFGVVWVHCTPANQALYALLLRRDDSSSISGFPELPADTEHDVLLRGLEFIEDHHYEGSWTGQWQEIVVFGLRDPNSLALALTDYPELAVDLARHAIVRRPA